MKVNRPTAMNEEYDCPMAGPAVPKSVFQTPPGTGGVWIISRVSVGVTAEEFVEITTPAMVLSKQWVQTRKLGQDKTVPWIEKQRSEEDAKFLAEVYKAVDADGQMHEQVRELIRENKTLTNANTRLKETIATHNSERNEDNEHLHAEITKLTERLNDQTERDDKQDKLFTMRMEIARKIETEEAFKVGQLMGEVSLLQGKVKWLEDERERDSTITAMVAHNAQESSRPEPITTTDETDAEIFELLTESFGQLGNLQRRIIDAQESSRPDPYYTSSSVYRPSLGQHFRRPRLDPTMSIAEMDAEIVELQSHNGTRDPGRIIDAAKVVGVFLLFVVIVVIAGVVISVLFDVS